MDDKSVKKVHLRVLTPTATKVDEAVDMVIMRCIGGDMGVLPGHETYVCVLDDGILRVLNRGRERRLAVFGGVAEVRDDVVTVLTEEAHWPGEIEKDRAEETREHLRRKIQEKTDDGELFRDQLLLRRTLLKIDLSDFPVDSEIDEDE